MPDFKYFSFRSHDRINRIHSCICFPDTSPCGIVQISHGITEHIGMYSSFMSFLSENGFIAAGNDHLGHGLSVSNDSDRGFTATENGWDHTAADIYRLSQIIKAKYPELPYFYFGFSMGSFLVRTCLIRYPDCCDAAVIAGTGFPTGSLVYAGYKIADSAARRKGVRYVSSGLSRLVFKPYNSRIEAPRTPKDWVSRDADEVDRFIADPLCSFAPSVGMYRDMFGGIIYVSDKNNIAKMDKDTPVFFISGSEDPVGSYGDGVYASFKAFLGAGMRNATMKLYGGARHALLMEYCRDEVQKDIVDFYARYCR